MDLGNKTLNGILQAIADENVLVGYNTYRNRKGRIIVKISYDEPSICDQNEGSSDQFDKHRISVKKLSETQSKRNFHRAKKFREPSKDINLTKNSIEMPRNSEKIVCSTPVPNVLETSQCIEDGCLLESPITHVSSDHDQSCEEPFHDVCDSMSDVTPDVFGSASNEINYEPKVLKPPQQSKIISRVYDNGKFNSPQEAAKEPCDKKNCSFGPTPDKVDPSVVWSQDSRFDHEFIIKKCPHCELQVCMLCMKYRGRHRKYFIKPPPWD